MDKKRLLILIATAVICIIVVVALEWNSKQSALRPYVVKEVSQFTLPEYFPAGLPVPPGSKLVKNFSTTPQDRDQIIQSVQVYQVHYDPGQVFGLFKNYFFGDKVWRIVNETRGVRDTDMSILFVQNPRGSLTVTIAKDLSAPIESKESILEIRFAPQSNQKI